jgi:hypothetical protein
MGHGNEMKLWMGVCGGWAAEGWLSFILAYVLLYGCPEYQALEI